MPDETPYRDFTWRDFRPDHQPNPTPKGVHYPILMTPQKAGSLLSKVAFKSKFSATGKGRGAAKGKGGKSAGRTVIAVGQRK